MKPRREVELHAPVAGFLRGMGYEVRSEVKDCDVVGIRPLSSGGDEIVVVELKRGLTIDLLIQGVKRQRAAELVYLAIPRPDRFWFTRKWRDILHLLRRLELGLILVQLASETEASVEVVLDPQALDRQKSQAQHSRKRIGLLKEFKARSADLNIGGSSGVPLMTAYRERCLSIAQALATGGPLSPAKLRSDSNDHKTANMLQDNHYGWFERIGRGIYGLTAEGQMALSSFAAEHPEFTAAGSARPNSPAQLPEPAPKGLKKAKRK